MYEEDKSPRFLIGLKDDSYLGIQSQILALEPMPSLAKLFNTVMQEEHYKKMMVGWDDHSETVMAFTTNHGA